MSIRLAIHTVPYPDVQLLINRRWHANLPSSNKDKMDHQDNHRWLLQTLPQLLLRPAVQSQPTQLVQLCQTQLLVCWMVQTRLTCLSNNSNNCKMPPQFNVSLATLSITWTQLQTKRPMNNLWIWDWRQKKGKSLIVIKYNNLPLFLVSLKIPVKRAIWWTQAWTPNSSNSNNFTRCNNSRQMLLQTILISYKKSSTKILPSNKVRKSNFLQIIKKSFLEQYLSLMNSLNNPFNLNFLLAQQAAQIGNFPASMFPFPTATQQSHQPTNFLFSALATNAGGDEKSQQQRLSSGFVPFPQTTSATARHS